MQETSKTKDSPLQVSLIEEVAIRYQQLRNELARIIVGYEDIIEKISITLFCGGHALLVGAPGLAKTLLVTSLARILGLSFRRIQFTPDLMPADITGVEIFSRDGEFRYVKGPIFANVILADEINRAPPKTQSALLEAMQEKQVTVGNTTYPLPLPFFVLATQNPIEHEGTYPLPEAQLDRFMMMLLVDYPSIEQEVEILNRTTGTMTPSATPIFNQEMVIAIQRIVREVPASENVVREVVTTVQKTRPHTHLAPSIVKEYVEWGAGPRASQSILLALKCKALLEGKGAADIYDLPQVIHPILRHRIILNYKAEIDRITSDKIIDAILA